jgi:NitT/TauT family transport system substrate-binding protein
MRALSQRTRVQATHLALCAVIAVFAAGRMIGEVHAAPVSLNVGYGLAADFLPAFVAKDEGIFAHNDLDVTLTSFPNTSVIVPAIISGSIRIGASTLPNLVLASEGGLNLVGVSGAARLTKENPRTALLTRKNFSISKAADLIGRKVAVPGINSIFDLFLRKWLIDGGVSPNQVTIVEAPFTRMGDLLKSGQVDAVVAVEPLLSRIVESGSGDRSIDYLSEVSPDVVGSVWATTREWGTANGQTIAAYRKSLGEALDFIKSNPARTKEIEIKYIGFSGATLPTLSLDLRPADFDVFLGISKELGLISQPIDANQMILTGR